MRSHLERIALFGLACAIASPGSAAPTGAAFLKINPSARISALGDAGSALEPDAAALFTNPAGAGFLSGRQLFFSHSQGMLGSTLDAFSYVHALSIEDKTDGWIARPNEVVPTATVHRSNVVLGVSAVYRSEGDLQGYSNGQLTDTFRASDTMASIAIAKPFSSRLSLGTNAKMIRQQIGGYQASGYAFDLGAFYRTAVRGLSFSGTVSNLGPDMKFISVPYSLPRKANLGLGYAMRSVSLAMDLTMPLTKDQSKSFGLGLEFMPASSLTVRGGYINTLGQSVSGSGSQVKSGGTLSNFAGFSAGLGLRLNRFYLDYALLLKETADETHRLSASYAFK